MWRDAVKIQNRVYHASCHAEIKKDGASTPLRTGTPDSVLGKRKAGVCPCLFSTDFHIETDEGIGTRSKPIKIKTHEEPGSFHCNYCRHHCVIKSRC